MAPTDSNNGLGQSLLLARLDAITQDIADLRSDVKNLDRRLDDLRLRVVGLVTAAGIAGAAVAEGIRYLL